MGGASFVANAAVIPAISAEPRSIITSYASLSHPRKLPLDDQGALRVPTYEDLFDRTLVDAIYIATPNSMHVSPAIAAMRKGISVLCEKPIAVSTRELDELAAVEAETGSLVMEAYMTAFSRRDQEWRRVVKTGVLGKLRDIEAAFTFTLVDQSNYRWRPELGGGALADVGIYLLDPIIDLLGEPSETQIDSLESKSGVVKSLRATLFFGRQIRARITCSFEAPEAQVLKIAGTQATLRVERPFTPTTRDTTFALERGEGTQILRAMGNDPYAAMVKSFVDSHLGTQPALRSLGASRQVAALVERILEGRKETG